MADSIPVTVKILDKDYRIACPAEEQNALLASADLLNSRMRELKEGGNVIGTDRIAVMAALNMTHEMIEIKDDSSSISQSMSKRLRKMQEKIEDALQDTKQLEI